MARFTYYAENCKDEIIVDNWTKRQADIISKTSGYEFDENGECVIEMQFRDGIAFTTDGSGLAMVYPKLKEVEQSEKMQDAIYEHTGRTDATQFDVALTFGRLVKYKHILDYNEWVKQGDNASKDIYGMGTEKEHLFDLFESDWISMDNRGLVDDMEISLLKGNPTRDQIERMQARYGILWTDKIADKEAA